MLTVLRVMCKLIEPSKVRKIMIYFRIQDYMNIYIPYWALQNDTRLLNIKYNIYGNFHMGNKLHFIFALGFGMHPLHAPNPTARAQQRYNNVTTLVKLSL